MLGGGGISVPITCTMCNVYVEHMLLYASKDLQFHMGLVESVVSLLLYKLETYTHSNLFKISIRDLGVQLDGNKLV